MNDYPIATILGGGGFIGRYLVRKMTEKNYQCIIPTRNAYLKGYLKTQAPPGAIEFIDFNLKDFSKIEEAIKNSDIVINLIGILFENSKQKFSDLHADLPGLIAKYCSQSEVKKFIHDTEKNDCCGLFLSQNYGIANKENFQIDLNIIFKITRI